MHKITLLQGRFFAKLDGVLLRILQFPLVFVGPVLTHTMLAYLWRIDQNTFKIVFSTFDIIDRRTLAYNWRSGELV